MGGRLELARERQEWVKGVGVERDSWKERERKDREYEKAKERLRGIEIIYA